VADRRGRGDDRDQPEHGQGVDDPEQPPHEGLQEPGRATVLADGADPREALPERPPGESLEEHEHEDGEREQQELGGCGVGVVLREVGVLPEGDAAVGRAAVAVQVLVAVVRRRPVRREVLVLELGALDQREGDEDHHAVDDGRADAPAHDGGGVGDHRHPVVLPPGRRGLLGSSMSWSGPK
jgi:hypothetical protein